jgi:hypothetical protein
MVSKLKTIWVLFNALAVLKKQVVVGLKYPFITTIKVPTKKFTNAVVVL